MFWVNSDECIACGDSGNGRGQALVFRCEAIQGNGHAGNVARGQQRVWSSCLLMLMVGTAQAAQFTINGPVPRPSSWRAAAPAAWFRR